MKSLPTLNLSPPKSKSFQILHAGQPYDNRVRGFAKSREMRSLIKGTWHRDIGRQEQLHQTTASAQPQQWCDQSINFNSRMAVFQSGAQSLAIPSRHNRVERQNRDWEIFLQLSFFIIRMPEKYPGSESGPREWFGHRADIPHAAPRQEAKCQGESVRFFLGENLL